MTVIHYNYRWLYAGTIFILVILLGYHYDLSAHKKELIHLLNEKKNEEKMSVLHPSNKRALQRALPRHQAANYLLDVSMLANRHGVVLDKILLIKSAFTAAEGQKLQVVVHGDYAHVAAFLLGLFQQNYTVLVSQFSYKVKSMRDVMFSGELVALNEVSDYLPQSKQTSPNPFCGMAIEDLTSINDSQQQNESLSTIRMIGYVQQGERKQAMIVLPSHAVLAVVEGMHLGREQGEISEITPNFIRLTLPKNTQILLKM